MIANCCSDRFASHPGIWGTQAAQTILAEDFLLHDPEVCHWLLIVKRIARARRFTNYVQFPARPCHPPVPKPPYLVLMCFSLPGEYRKLLA